MRVRPALEPGWLAHDPVHAAMFGGTNSGKSTVLNALLGRAAAGMSYQARFSQHPEAYRLSALRNRFLEAFPSRFAGYALHFDRHPPRQDDASLRSHGYRPALAVIDPTRLGAAALASPATVSAVLWDIPDFSTEEARLYDSAVLDTIALADLVVLTLTRENYADHRAGLLFALVAEAGPALRVALNKLEPGSHLPEEARRRLDAAAPGALDPARLHPLPQVDAPDEEARLRLLLDDPGTQALRRGLADDVARGPALKRRCLRATLDFLDRRLDDALAPLHADVAAARRWRDAVDRAAREDFYDRHRRDYLDGEKYADFNHTLVKLMDLLELPGVGPVIAAVSKGIRSASRLVLGSLVKGVKRILPGGRARRARPGPELEAVAEAFEATLTRLRGDAQALAQAEPDPRWAEVVAGLDRLMADPRYIDDLGSAYQDYRLALDELTSRRARALYDQIARRPALLHTLRGLKTTLDVGSTALVVSSKGLDWTDAVLGPLVAPVQRLILEFGMEQVVALQKAQLKRDQQTALRDVVESRMLEPLRRLYRTAASADDLDAARRDLETLRATLDLTALEATP
jgi:hypothetical protein